jgi:predicted sulfurtransferase
MFASLINIGKQLAKELGKKATKEAAKEIGKKFATEMAIQGGTTLAAKGIENIFSSKEMDIEEKLKQLKKLRDSGDLTKNEYETYRHKLMDASFS